MKKKAVILDLDNTIYSSPSIGNELFESLFKMIEESGEYSGEMEDIKKDITQKAFQKVAEKYKFSEKLNKDGINLLKDLTYDKPISPFEDYKEVKNLSCKKYLVTTGFTKLQQSKVEQLRLQNDFDEIHIADPMIGDRTKKDIFKDIMVRNHLLATDMLVVGDDPESEIKAGKDLGMDTVIYDRMGFNKDKKFPEKITNFRQLKDFL